LWDGERTIPLNSDALAALARLLERACDNGVHSGEHYVFPACENESIDPTRPQKTWRTAWRSLVKETSIRAGRQAAREALQLRRGLGDAKKERRRAAGVFAGLRFHDLRHQAITELAENGASDSTVMALAGHLSKAMMDHYSHIRMAAKRAAVDGLSSGLIQGPTSSEVKTTAIQ
jgi:integrase